MQSSIMAIVHDLRKAKGGNKKLAILRRERGNKHWKTFLWYTYNTALNYWVSAPKDLTFYPDGMELDYEDMFLRLGDLINQEFRGNLARDYALELSRRYGEPVRLALEGSIKAGVSITSINKAYPGLIPTFPLMLAQDSPIEQFPVYGFIKYDGVRATVHVSKEKTIIYLRSGKVLGLTSLVNFMASQEPGWYDGELVKGNGLQESRTKITGDVNRILKGSRDWIKDYTFQIFDGVSEEDWRSKSNSFTYDDRHRFLVRNLHESSSVKLAHYKILHNQKEVDVFMEDLYQRGYEGGIFRYPEDPYEWKRTHRMIKGKAKFEGIVKCTGVNEGTGKYEGLIGSLICEGILDCEGKRDPTHVRFAMGSGLSDPDREKDPSEFIGADIDMQYNDIVLAEGSDMHSVFIPVFKRIKGNYDV